MYVPIPEEDIHPAAASVVMPIVVRVIDAAVRMPRPIATDKFGYRPQGNFGRLNGRCGGWINYVAGKITRPFDEVAVTPTIPTGFGHWV